jgi:YidC/Oxa1 family membrane protein insertase
MDRDSLTRILLIALILLGGYWLFFGKKSGESEQRLPPEAYVSAPGFAPDVVDAASEGAKGVPSPPAETCSIEGNRFRAELSSHGAGLTHFFLTDARYASSKAADMVTTPDVERWRNLRTLFRETGTPAAPDDQVKYDRFDWKVAQSDPKTCTFTYEDPGLVRVVKTVKAGERPFELDLGTTVTNLADSPKKHRATIEAFAFRTNEEVKGQWGRVSPFQTDLECGRADGVKRLAKDAKEFKTGWYGEPLIDRFTAISNYYFAQAVVPLEAAPGAARDKPSCDILAEQWFSAGQKPDDDKAGDVYHARLAYPQRSLQPNESITYEQVTYFGPKERDVLAKAAGGWPHLGDLINLGTFSFVAKFLVDIIRWIHAHITLGNWGLAIIVLTVGLRIVLFPLTWKQIQSAIAMRRLKPEIDALNDKFKDDAQAKNLAMMEMYRKNKVNPLGGCLPALVQMPIWFALYATLQTAVEFYHTRFLWFSDLSAPDPLFILPLILGGAMIVQQRIVPQQGMDPVQAKMMMYLMPAIFTFMMLFLPAALGVYMLTNSLLGIGQQLAVEKLFPRVGAPAGSGIVVTKDKTAKKDDGGATPAPTLRKGKARV